MNVKVLLIQNSISIYRVPVYNIIAREVALTVAFSEGKVPKNIEFKALLIPAKKLKGYYIHNHSLSKIASQYDVVVGMMAFNWISNYLLAFKHRKFKFIPWGIGVPASYSVHYDDPTKKMNVFLTKLMLKHSDSIIFYSDYPIEKYIRMGIDKRKMFVAHNTVEVLDSKPQAIKDIILFVGTLYKAKSSLMMLELYKNAYEKVARVPNLVIVGSGDEYSDIKIWIEQNKLNHKIILEGAIYDEATLKQLFERALFCVSLGQAGLSVQKSMGYGVPFVTTVNAFTGGERFDIQNRVNGVLLNSSSEFLELVLDATQNPKTYVDMGISAKNFYGENRTIEMMAKEVIRAIEYAIAVK